MNGRARIQIRTVVEDTAAAQQFLLDFEKTYPRLQYDTHLSAIPYSDGKYFIVGSRYITSDQEWRAMREEIARDEAREYAEEDMRERERERWEREP